MRGERGKTWGGLWRRWQLAHRGIPAISGKTLWGIAGNTDYLVGAVRIRVGVAAGSISPRDFPIESTTPEIFL